MHPPKGAIRDSTMLMPRPRAASLWLPLLLVLATAFPACKKKEAAPAAPPPKAAAAWSEGLA